MLNSLLKLILAFFLPSLICIILFYIFIYFKKYKIRKNILKELNPFDRLNKTLELMKEDLSSEHLIDLKAVEEISEDEVMLDLVCDKDVFFLLTHYIVNTHNNKNLNGTIIKIVKSYFSVLGRKENVYSTYVINLKIIEHNVELKSKEVYKESLLLYKEDLYPSWRKNDWSELYNLGLKNYTGIDQREKEEKI